MSVYQLRHICLPTGVSVVIEVVKTPANTHYKAYISTYRRIPIGVSVAIDAVETLAVVAPPLSR